MTIKSNVFYFVISLLLSGLLVSCGGSSKNQTNEEGLKDDVLTIFFNTKKVNILRKVVNHYENMMCKEAKTSDRQKCYVSHSHAIRRSVAAHSGNIVDVFPYKIPRGLEGYKDKLHLKLIWDLNCKNPKDQKFICLKREGSYMNFLKEIGRKNPLIKQYHKEFKEDGRVSQEILHTINTVASEKLDFNNFNHRFFYLVHHLTSASYK